MTTHNLDASSHPALDARLDALEGLLYLASAYGADPESADNTSAIQAGLDAAGQAGAKGLLLDVPGTYTMTSYSTSNHGTNFCLIYKYSGIHLYGLGDITTLKVDTPVAAAGIIIDGGAIAAGPGNPTDYSDYPYFIDAGGTPPTIYTMSGTVAKGATSVTLATAAHANNFAVGDWIAIRTGQTIDFSAAGQPDAEFNQVAAKPGGGVLTLRYPTQKRYAQEYYVSGTTGRTTTAVTANAAPFGVQNVDDRIIHDVGLHNLRLESVVNRHFLIGGGIENISLTDLSGEFTGGASFMSSGGFRGFYASNWRFEHQGIASWVYLMSADSGCSNVTLRNIRSEADGTVYLHLHEGSSNVLVDGLWLHSAPTTEDEALVSIRGRCYDLALVNYHLQGGGDTAAIYVDAYSGSDGAGGGGGMIGPGFIDAPNATGSIVVNPTSGWQVRPGIIHGATPLVIPRTIVIENGERGFSAGELSHAWGSDTLVVNHTPPYRSLPNGADTYITVSFAPPPDWQSMDVWVATANMGADTTGTYTIGLLVKVFEASDLLTEAVETSTGVTVSDVTENEVVWSTMAVTVPCTAGAVHTLEFYRLAADATIGNAVGLFYVLLRRSA